MHVENQCSILISWGDSQSWPGAGESLFMRSCSFAESWCEFGGDARGGRKARIVCHTLASRMRNAVLPCGTEDVYGAHLA